MKRDQAGTHSRFLHQRFHVSRHFIKAAPARPHFQLVQALANHVRRTPRESSALRRPNRVAACY